MRFPTRFNKNARDETKYIFGRFIKDQQVLCIDQDNKNLGLIDTRDALQLAKDAGLELVVVSQGQNGRPSTARILDFSKYKYEKEKQEKQTKKKQRENAIKIKEVKLRPATGDNDLQVKANQLKEFLQEGNRVKVTVLFKGREMAHREIGMDTLKRFAIIISAQFDGDPSITGRNLIAWLIKKAESNP